MMDGQGFWVLEMAEKARNHGSIFFSVLLIFAPFRN